MNTLHDRCAKFKGKSTCHKQFTCTVNSINGRVGKTDSGCIIFTRGFDIHRDAIEPQKGRIIKAAAEIGGKTAAQVMIISGCDDGRFGNMPEYLENFRLACLIQQSAEKRYPGLARPVLFDYRNYNQHISTGSLLIEVGSHANSLDEAVYTGELLGECLSDALAQLSPEVGDIS